MKKTLTAIIHLLLVFCFMIDQISLSLAYDGLAPSLASDVDMVPDRSAGIREEVVHTTNPEAIGNGKPLLELAKGALPPRIFPPNEDSKAVGEVLRKAAGIALELGILHQSDVPAEYAPRYERVLNRLIALQNALETNVYLFNAVVRGPEDYLLGFNAEGKVGLALELIPILNNISPKRLAQYVFHECFRPKGPVSDRDDHRAIYTTIQALVFGKDEVSALKEDLRGFIDKNVDGPASGAAPENLINIHAWKRDIPDTVRWLIKRVEKRMGVRYSAAVKKELISEFGSPGVFEKVSDSYGRKYDGTASEEALKTLIFQEAILLYSAVPSSTGREGHRAVDAGIDDVSLHKMRTARQRFLKDKARLTAGSEPFWRAIKDEYTKGLDVFNKHKPGDKPKISINILSTSERFRLLLERIRDVTAIAAGQ
ncbi:MAG: hypothetical protein PHS37_07715, partial [Candidatus Omnitrophica bacterium]|nr:hypothetical protein [Candidatus Omnitrophota bacterium]